MTITFDHEKLKAYQTAIQFIVWLQTILENIPRKHAVHDLIKEGIKSKKRH
jgi:hypothetical protein